MHRINAGLSACWVRTLLTKLHPQPTKSAFVHQVVEKQLPLSIILLEQRLLLWPPEQGSPVVTQQNCNSEVEQGRRERLLDNDVVICVVI